MSGKYFGLYTAKRIDNGEKVVGNLVYFEEFPFAYILTKENYGRMVVDELNDGHTTCNLIRVMPGSIEPVNGEFSSKYQTKVKE